MRSPNYQFKRRVELESTMQTVLFRFVVVQHRRKTSNILCNYLKFWVTTRWKWIKLKLSSPVIEGDGSAQMEMKHTVPVHESPILWRLML